MHAHLQLLPDDRELQKPVPGAVRAQAPHRRVRLLQLCRDGARRQHLQAAGVCSSVVSLPGGLPGGLPLPTLRAATQSPTWCEMPPRHSSPPMELTQYASSAERARSRARSHRPLYASARVCRSSGSRAMLLQCAARNAIWPCQYRPRGQAGCRSTSASAAATKIASAAATPPS